MMFLPVHRLTGSIATHDGVSHPFLINDSYRAKYRYAALRVFQCLACHGLVVSLGPHDSEPPRFNRYRPSPTLITYSVLVFIVSLQTVSRVAHNFIRHERYAAVKRQFGFFGAAAGQRCATHNASRYVTSPQRHDQRATMARSMFCRAQVSSARRPALAVQNRNFRSSRIRHTP